MSYAQFPATLILERIGIKIREADEAYFKAVEEEIDEWASPFKIFGFTLFTMSRAWATEEVKKNPSRKVLRLKLRAISVRDDLEGLASICEQCKFTSLVTLTDNHGWILK